MEPLSPESGQIHLSLPLTTQLSFRRAEGGGGTSSIVTNLRLMLESRHDPLMVWPLLKADILIES